MNNLKNIREKFGLTQHEVAHWLESLVQFYETGTRGLQMHAMLQVASWS